MEFFRQKQIEAFADFCDSDIYAMFDFEIDGCSATGIMTRKIL